jgi:hypothetical protein
LEDRRLLAFDPAVSYAAGSYPWAVVTADFNKDNHLDLATANAGDGSVSVLLGYAWEALQRSTIYRRALGASVRSATSTRTARPAANRTTDLSKLRATAMVRRGRPVDPARSPTPRPGDFNADAPGLGASCCGTFYYGLRLSTRDGNGT